MAEVTRAGFLLACLFAALGAGDADAQTYSTRVITTAGTRTVSAPFISIPCALLPIGSGLSCSGGVVTATGAAASTANSTTPGVVPTLGGVNGAAATDNTGRLVGGEIPTSVLTTALENTASGIPTLTNGALSTSVMPSAVPLLTSGELAPSTIPIDGSSIVVSNGKLTSYANFAGGTITGGTSVAPTGNLPQSLTVGLPAGNGYAYGELMPRATDSGTGDVTQAAMLDIEDYNYATYGQYCCGINNGKASLQINRYLGSGSQVQESATGVTVNLVDGSSHAFGDEDVDFNAQVNKTGTDSTWGFSGQTNDSSGLPAQSFSALALEYDINATGQDNPASVYDAQNANRWFIYLAPKVYGFGTWAASTSYNVGAVIHATAANGVDSVYKVVAPSAITTASAASASGSTSLSLTSATGFAAGQVIQDTNTGATALISSISGTTATLGNGGFTLPVYGGTKAAPVASGDTIAPSVAGTSGSATPTWPNSGTVVDNGVTWTYEETVAVEVGTAIWLDNGEDSRTSYGTGLGTNGRYLNAVIDTSLATLVNPGTAAIRVAAGQPIDLTGTSTAAGQNQHTLAYSGSALTYKTPSGSALTVSDAGLTTSLGGFAAPLATPASSSAACTTGQREADANYVYICTATNTWKRAALSTF